MKCLRQRTLVKGAMSMSKFIWTNFPWHLVWGIGLLTQRKLEQTHHRRKAEIREITGGRWYGPWSFPQQLSGSSLTSEVNPLSPTWPQHPAAPWNQDSLPTFHSAMIFADLSQSNVSCQVPKLGEMRQAALPYPTLGSDWPHFQILCCSPFPSVHKSGVWPGQ